MNRLTCLRSERLRSTNYSDYTVFVDESGDHNVGSIDRDYPLFALDFCIFHKSPYANVVVPVVHEFKFEHFGHDAVVLHEHDIRKQKPPFAFLKSLRKRESFMAGLNQLIANAEFTVVATIIDKKRHRQRHVHPENPNDLSLASCMARAHAFLREKVQHARTTHIVVECRGRREDMALELAFHRIRSGSNAPDPMPGFEIVFADKKINSPGLQLADLTARPIRIHSLRPDQANRSWNIVSQKLYRDRDGNYQKWGVKTFP